MITFFLKAHACAGCEFLPFGIYEQPNKAKFIDDTLNTALAGAHANSDAIVTSLHLHIGARVVVPGCSPQNFRSSACAMLHSNSVKCRVHSFAFYSNQ